MSWKYFSFHTIHTSQRGQKVKILIRDSPIERHNFTSKISLYSQNTTIDPPWLDSPAEDIPAPLPLVWLGVDVGVGFCLSSYMLAVIPVVAMLSGRCRRPPALPGLRRTPPTVFLCAESAEPGLELEEFSLDKPGSAKRVSGASRLSSRWLKWGKLLKDHQKEHHPTFSRLRD